MKVAEHFFGPEIDAAFAGIAMSKFNHRDALRPKEKKQRNDPEPNCDTAVGRNRRHHVEVEYRNNKKQYEIATPESTD